MRSYHGVPLVLDLDAKTLGHDETPPECDIEVSAMHPNGPPSSPSPDMWRRRILDYHRVCFALESVRQLLECGWLTLAIINSYSPVGSAPTLLERRSCLRH